VKKLNKPFFVGTLIALSVQNLQAQEWSIKDLMVGAAQSVQSSPERSHRKDITYLSGEQRKEMLKKILGDKYREDELPVMIQGTDINTFYYESVVAGKRTPLSVRSMSATGKSGTKEAMPDDPFFMEWQYKNFETTDASNQASPNSVTPYNLTIPLAPSVIGIIDGEYSGNPDISIIDGMGFYASDSDEISEIKRIHEQFDNGSKKVCGESGSVWHGLGVASIAAAHMNNNIGMAGYSQSDVVYAKAMQCNFGWEADITRAMYWQSGASKEQVPNELWVEDLSNWRQIEPVDVINMSLGGGETCSEGYQRAFDFAMAQNTPVVAAAGNENHDGATVPAICEGAIGVVALDGDGNKARYSNYGRGADIAVIGTGVAAYSVPESYGEGEDISTKIPQSMRYMSGTSMATPIVSAVVAQIRQIDPSITPVEILNLLQETADPFPEDSNCNSQYYCGAGVLNAERAIQVASGRDTGELAVADPVANSVEECLEETLTLNAQGLKKICETYDVDLSGLRYSAREFKEIRFEFYQVEVGGTVRNDDEMMASSSSPYVKLHNLNSRQYDYIARACDGEACSTPIDAYIQIAPYESNICN